ncbi:helix-turn-helix transcriptional regulator [Microbacterium hydrocarbonoxydans]|uniref:helix-turn-helix transcriptional regulator n=1 Tax=Microbacterium hydrocarbonoxydans TaxID=273678 RepID=UPI00203BF194|nr:AraC family transcriptional regulator [Microbacterium hydrocarbonoxydans]MCM3778500.1 AraC family transcriptional regulator [Microbacterium hydrocarbonoxydans]
MQNWAIYAAPARTLADVTIACLGAGEYSGRNEGFRDRQLRSHAAVVVSEGSGWYSSPLTGDVRIDAPSLLWLFPGVVHGYGPLRSGWTEHWVLFSGAATRALDELGAWRRTKPIVPLFRVPASLRSTFDRLHSDLVDSGSAAALRASAAGYAWIAELAAITMPASAPDLIEAFTRGAARQIPMETRARELGLSVGQLRAAAVAATGHTPLQLLIDSRLARAQSLLVETDLEVGAIARQVGFEDPSYFSRQFTQRLGRSPSMFRDEQRRMPISAGLQPEQVLR